MPKNKYVASIVARGQRGKSKKVRNQPRKNFKCLPQHVIVQAIAPKR